MSGAMLGRRRLLDSSTFGLFDFFTNEPRMSMKTKDRCGLDRVQRRCRLARASVFVDIWECLHARQAARKKAALRCRTSSLQPSLADLEGLQDGLGFVQAFLVFAGGDGVGHDAGSGLQVGGFIFD